MRKALLLWLVLIVILAGPCWSTITDSYLWLLPYESVNLSLTSSPTGAVLVNKTRQEEPRCWKLVPTGAKDTYHLLCAGYGGKRGLSIKDGKLYLASDQGLAWKVQEEGTGRFRVSCSQGQLDFDSKTERPILVKEAIVTWTIWSRQLLSHTPDPGNYVRSDQAEFWQVQVDGLRGRSEPNPKSPVVRRFRRGQQLKIDYGRGGSDVVAWNAVDDDGNTWIRVSTRDGKPLNCYIRANSRWVVPMAEHQK